MMSRENILNNHLDFPGRSILAIGEKPSSRALFSMTLFQHTLFVYGGIKSDILGEMWCCKINDHDQPYKWVNVTKREKKLYQNYYIPNPRFGHTAVLHKDEIYIFGGRVKEGKPREDLITFNVHTFKFINETCFCKSEFSYRRHHIAE